MGEEEEVIRITARESEVLQQLGQGKDVYEMAAELGVQKRTIDFHLHRLYEKFNVPSMWKLYHKARSLKILQ